MISDRTRPAIPQSTFPEAKRVARGLAHGPNLIGWSAIIGELALVHKDTTFPNHHLRLDGSLIPDWWGKPRTESALLDEIRELGQDGVALYYNALGLVLLSDDGSVDIQLDELISRIGLTPRSTNERGAARLWVWRALTVLAGLAAIGARRKNVFDRVTCKYVRLESDDAHFYVTPWREVGAQLAFDDGAVPLMVTIQATPWIARWRNDRAVLQDFGNVLAICEIPSGKPSGAWARSIGWALNQIWREQATHVVYTRNGERNNLAVRFEDLTRRRLLDLLPPDPTVHDVLNTDDPARAIRYWDAAIQQLMRKGIVRRCEGRIDWSVGKRSRKGWKNEWLDEQLDIRPPAEETSALAGISSAHRKKNRAEQKRRQPATSNQLKTAGITAA